MWFQYSINRFADLNPGSIHLPGSIVDIRADTCSISHDVIPNISKEEYEDKSEYTVMSL